MASTGTRRGASRSRGRTRRFSTCSAPRCIGRSKAVGVSTRCTSKPVGRVGEVLVSITGSRGAPAAAVQPRRPRARRRVQDRERHRRQVRLLNSCQRAGAILAPHDETLPGRDARDRARRREHARLRGPADPGQARLRRGRQDAAAARLALRDRRDPVLAAAPWPLAGLGRAPAAVGDRRRLRGELAHVLHRPAHGLGVRRGAAALLLPGDRHAARRRGGARAAHPAQRGRRAPGLHRLCLRRGRRPRLDPALRSRRGSVAARSRARGPVRARRGARLCQLHRDLVALRRRRASAGARAAPGPGVGGRLHRARPRERRRRVARLAPGLAPGRRHCRRLDRDRPLHVPRGHGARSARRGPRC